MATKLKAVRVNYLPAETVLRTADVEGAGRVRRGRILAALCRGVTVGLTAGATVSWAVATPPTGTAAGPVGAGTPRTTRVVAGAGRGRSCRPGKEGTNGRDAQIGTNSGFCRTASGRRMSDAQTEKDKK